MNYCPSKIKFATVNLFSNSNFIVTEIRIFSVEWDLVGRQAHHSIYSNQLVMVKSLGVHYLLRWLVPFLVLHVVTLRATLLLLEIKIVEMFQTYKNAENNVTSMFLPHILYLQNVNIQNKE